MNKTLIAACVLGLAGSANADYQFEINPEYSTGDIEVSGVDADIDVFSPSISYYFNPVDTSKGPLAEANFLSRASGVTATYIDGEIDFDGGGDEDFDGYEISGMFVFGDGWILDLGYQEIETDDLDLEVDSTSVAIGRYVGTATTVKLSYRNDDFDEPGFSDDYDVWSVDFKTVGDTSGMTYALEGSLGQHEGDTDDADTFSLGVTLYPTSRLGFGLSYSLANSDETEEEVVELFAEMFVTDGFALKLAYEDSSDDEINLDSDSLVFSARVRF